MEQHKMPMVRYTMHLDNAGNATGTAMITQMVRLTKTTQQYTFNADGTGKVDGSATGSRRSW